MVNYVMLFQPPTKTKHLTHCIPRRWPPLETIYFFKTFTCPLLFYFAFFFKLATNTQLPFDDKKSVVGCRFSTSYTPLMLPYQAAFKLVNLFPTGHGPLPAPSVTHYLTLSDCQTVPTRRAPSWPFGQSTRLATTQNCVECNQASVSEDRIRGLNCHSCTDKAKN